MTSISAVGKPFRAALIVISALACLLYASSPANARPWKANPSALAQDYAQILDTRANGNLVLLFWFVPQMVEELPEAQAMLDKYVVIGVVHGHVQPGGTMTFDAIDALQVKDATGAPLKLLKGDDIPPAVAGFLTTMEGSMRQAIGAMGQGMRFFAYDGGNVHTCQKGGLSIPYDGETYTYVTPIPGCSAK